MIRVTGLAGVLIVAALACPPSGEAACGGAVIGQPSHRVAGQLPPLTIGDSTMLLSVPGLAAAGYEVNAQGCRQLYQAIALLSGLQARHELPHMVVIALGANGPITAAAINATLKVLCCGRLLVLVTPRETGGAVGQNAAVERAAARADPGSVLLLDWVSYSAGHPGWFQPDGLHLTASGAAAFTQLLAQALPYAYDVAPCVAARSALRHAGQAPAAVGARRR